MVQCLEHCHPLTTKGVGAFHARISKLHLINIERPAMTWEMKSVWESRYGNFRYSDSLRRTLPWKQDLVKLIEPVQPSGKWTKNFSWNYVYKLKLRYLALYTLSTPAIPPRLYSAYAFLDISFLSLL
jgi:hypothetical protein